MNLLSKNFCILLQGTGGCSTARDGYTGNGRRETVKDGGNFAISETLRTEGYSKFRVGEISQILSIRCRENHYSNYQAPL